MLVHSFLNHGNLSLTYTKGHEGFAGLFKSLIKEGVSC